MKIGHYQIHRKEQWDLDDVKPLVCVHKTYDGGNAGIRILCIAFAKGKPIIVFNNPFKYRY